MWACKNPVQTHKLPAVTMRAEFKVRGPEMSQYGLGSAGTFLLILFVFAICLYNSTFVLPEHSV